MIDPFYFEQGLYSCGSSPILKSLKSGATCKSYSDCPSTVPGVYAKCDCSYS